MGDLTHAFSLRKDLDLYGKKEMQKATNCVWNEDQTRTRSINKKARWEEAASIMHNIFGVIVRV